MAAIADRRGPTPGSTVRRIVPLIAVVTSAGSALIAMAVTPADLLGYDFAAYLEAARRLVEGRPLYDLSVTQTGGFGFYYYPPQFAALLVPFLAPPTAVAPWAWAGILYLAFVGGVLAMPVARDVRWLTLLVFGVSWPFAYSLKLGQVGPLLVLVFALGWRWLDRPARLGLTIALGTVIKLQPVLLLGWALTTRRWRALLTGLTVLAVLSLAILPLVGDSAFVDFIMLVVRVSQPVTTPHNFAPGAILYQAGVSVEIASTVQLASTAAVMAITIWAWFRREAEVGYLATVVASQLVSPILWDHYAIVLALPVAYLVAHRSRWTLALPLVMAWPLVGITPAAAYPLAFWVVLLGLMWRHLPRTSTDSSPTVAEATT